MNSKKVKDWIVAMRLRTLPLAVASIGMGGFLAYDIGQFDIGVFSLCLLTTLILQILSNLANDYGDTIHGADHEHRQGPQRAVQSGRISTMAMKKAMVITAILAVAS